MLALRILSLPLAMAAFTVLYALAIKSPEAVEVTNILIWLLLPVILIAKLGRKLFNRKQEN
ncbi:hypothetical protein [Agrobacterium tumefaciens]|uniref:hypothetical protein n=1 Tax=Agrobacterium tumefaciens TaxID=358 RepID=UPI0021CF91DE|nr:hypothetical protein [Agrobacterium tumefaciens]UXT99757.1 hypothetical protein FY129_20045 [Agrobacterium tumefaciens]